MIGKRPGLALVAALAALICAPAAAAQAQPAPFGHPCTAQNGVRFCPTADLGSRVPSWDGVPLDVDVTLPASGDGPFPTILLLHGLGQTKTTFEGPGGDPHYNSGFFASRGYAVVTPTARGFGNSCGAPVSRTAGCERGWTRLGDIRYEVRDLQYLTGLLVDEGIADRKAIGATGISYGGGFSTMLAFLRDRVRLPNGRLAKWKSPSGKRVWLTAAWPRWLWTNGEAIFSRNGRSAWSRKPLGVPVEAWSDLIFGVANLGFVAPLGSELSTDIDGWKAVLNAGRRGPKVEAVADNAYLYHGVASLKGRTSAILFQTGWTDALFPVPQALAGYRALRKRHPDAPVEMQIGDLGHMPANNHPLDTASFDQQGLRFFDAWLRDKGRKSPSGRVTARTMTCPREAPSGGGPFVAARFGALSRGSLRFGTAKTLKIDSLGASAELANRLSATAVNLCDPVASDPTSHATFSRKSPGLTLIGLPVLSGRVSTSGRYGQIDARLWDLDPVTQTQRLITRGVYRLTDDQRGRFRFVLDGNGWRFPAGHRIVVELLGRDAPTYLASPTSFSARLHDLRITLPVRERGAT